MVSEPAQLSTEDQRHFDALLSKGVNLPPQPKVLIEIDHLASQPRVNNKAIASLVSSDPALSAALFKIVNSPATGLRRRVDTIDSAITVLGLKQVINLIKCSAIRKAIGDGAAVYEKFWERSADIARLAAIIAQKRVSVCNIFPDQAYMAGLFYECGVPLLMQRFPEYAKSFQLADSGGWPDLGAEDSLFNTDHSIAGYLVSRTWHLPDFISAAIRYHHDIDNANLEHRAMVAMLQMAAHLYNLRYSQPDEPEWNDDRLLVLQELGLSEEGEQEFAEEVLDALLSAAK
jgi:HD-like signal output (HDOD) protein